MAWLEHIPVLSIMVAAPLIGLLALLAVPKDRSRQLQFVAAAAMAVPFLLSLAIFGHNSASDPSALYSVERDWFRVDLPHTGSPTAAPSSIRFQYALGIDGISHPLVTVSALLGFMAAFASVYIKKRRKAYYGWLLLLESSLIGAFLARDLWLAFIGIQLFVLASAMLIGIWGETGRTKTAWLLVNGISSVLLLAAFALLISTAGAQTDAGSSTPHTVYSGSYAALANKLADPQGWNGDATAGQDPFSMGNGMSWIICLLLLGGFGIRFAVFPLHTWLIKAVTEAPVPVAMLIAGSAVPFGAYGMLRYGLLLFPVQAQQLQAGFAAFGVVMLLYGAALAGRQQSLRMGIAYSVLGSSGMVLLGFAALNALGLQGALFLLLSQGLVSALLLLLAGAIQERTRSVWFSGLGGLARPMPFISGAWLAGSLAQLGLPGLSSFIGILFVLLGLFDELPLFAAIAALGLLFGAWAAVRSVMRAFYGQAPDRITAARDARLIEAVPIIILLSFIVLLGCYPSIVTESFRHDMNELFGALFASKAGGG
ncbi:complex I subunit 4 family protein [Paenibacillus protaetiae]|uniref:NADH-quinone oxidoreductase subunit M n=1 Tax=Paenibacillus protaetiae TaxID=2509456 RepID=A0A4P6F3I3_9BACL|nr:NADH-quinone oxidoreductase subunit M [Paenibacillus protaetiae]QAY67717.1 NADH-quinone oxidoreductase subunit M [Paenibacillus protaetiae]